MNKSGAFYTYDGEKLGQGRDNVKQYLLEHTKVMDKIEKEIKSGKV